VGTAAADLLLVHAAPPNCRPQRCLTRLAVTCQALGFEDFFSLDLLRSHKGLHVLSMEEFLAKEGVTGRLKYGKLPPGNESSAWGNKLWDYLSSVADSHPDWGGKVRRNGGGEGVSGLLSWLRRYA